MSFSSTTSRVSYAGNGSTTVFSFPYYFLANADLVVVLRVDSTGVETVKTITTHYTVSGAGESAGGSVTMVTAPASGETLVIYRDPAITQGLDLAENDSLPAESVERAFDRLTMIAQRLDQRADSAMRLPETITSSDFDPTFPVAIAGAESKVPVTNEDGDGWADPDDWPSTSDIADAEENATAAAASAAAALVSQTAAAASATAAAASAASIFLVTQTTQALSEGATNQNITALLFAGASYKAVIIEYYIYRVSTGGSATEKLEVGTLLASYKPTAATWTLTQLLVGGEDSSVTLSITNAGQVQYTSDTLAGTGPTSKIVFTARGLAA